MKKDTKIDANQEIVTLPKISDVSFLKSSLDDNQIVDKELQTNTYDDQL